mgnify:CR=1 FL=1
MKRPQILVLHGWSLSADRYSPLIQELSHLGYSVYAPDLPGFGKAKAPIYPFTLGDYADFLHSYIKENNITTPILIGHSFGGRIIIKYVTSHGTDVKAIILCGTPGFTPIKKSKLIASLVLAKIGGFIFSLPGLSTFEEKIRGWFYYVIGARDFYRAQGSMRQTFKNIVSEKLEKNMKNIRIPTLLIWGEEDVIVPVKIAERMKETIPNAKLVILPHGKHSVIIDDPEAFVKEVCSFL